MSKQVIYWLKRVGIGIVIFILGFFLIKRGIDQQKLATLALEKAKDDEMKRAEEAIRAKETCEIELDHLQQLQRLEEERKKQEEELKKETEREAEVAKKEAKEKPDEFGKKFSERFKVKYNKRR